MPADSKTQEMAEFLLKIKAEGEEEASKATAKFSKSLDGLKKSSSSVLAPIQKLSSLVSGGLGFGKSINFVEDYYKAMTKLSGQMLKYGNSAKSLEKEINSLSKTFRMTKMETIDLMSEFEKGFPLASARAFKDIMVKITNVVGANKQAASEYIGVLGGISDLMPELQSSMQGLTKLDKDRLNNASKLMMMEGKMNLQTAKSLNNFIGQNKQILQADDEHVKKWKSFMGSMQDIRRQFEQITMVLGEAFVPLIKDIAKYMTENKDTIVKWVSIIGKVSAVLIPVVLAFKAINGLAGGINKTMGAWSAKSLAKGGKGGGGGMGGDCVPVCGAGGGVGGAGGVGGNGLKTGRGGFGRNLQARVDRLAGRKGRKILHGKFLGATKGALKATGKIIGKSMAVVGGAMMGREVGGMIGKQIGESIGIGGEAGAGVGRVAGATAGGAAAGFQVGGPVGALIGGAVGFVGSGIKELVDWISREDPEQLRHRQYLDKIAANTASIKTSVATGAISYETGKIKEEKSTAQGALAMAEKDLKLYKKELLKINNAKILRESGHGAASYGMTNTKGGVKTTGQTYEESKETLGKNIKFAEERIKEAQKTIKEAPKRLIAQKTKEQKGRVQDHLKLQNNQRELEYIDMQNKRLERQKSLVSEITGDLDSRVRLMLLGAKIDDESLKNQIAQTKVAMEAEKEISRERLARAKGTLADSQQNLKGKSSEYALAKARTSPETMKAEMKKKLAELAARKEQFEKENATREDKKVWQDDMGTDAKRLTEETKQHEDDLKVVKEYEADVAMVEKSQIAIKREVSNQNRLIAEGTVLWKKRTAAIEIDKQLHAGTASIMEAQIGILDQMGMGIGAPAEMRYQLMQQIGMQVVEVEKQIAIAKEKAAKGDEGYKDAQKEIKKYELERLQLIQKQYSVSKSLREGWVSALSAMTVASGRITKIMIDRQSNLAEGLKQGMVTSNVSGKLGAGGGRNSERFGISLAGGLNISGGGNAGFQTDFGPDVRKVNKMHENIRKGNIDKASKIATSQGTFMANKAMSGSGTAHLKGPGLVAATQPGASGIKNVPGRNVGAGGGQPKTGERASGNIPGKDVGSGGGWAKTDKQGVTVFNVSIEVHNKAEMTKFLKDLAKLVYPK